MSFTIAFLWAFSATLSSSQCSVAASSIKPLVGGEERMLWEPGQWIKSAVKLGSTYSSALVSGPVGADLSTPALGAIGENDWCWSLQVCDRSMG
jgi:hypothetical protein